MSVHQAVEPTDHDIRVERRHERFLAPLCTSCGSHHTTVVCRTCLVLYVRCARCGEVWSVPKPGHDAIDS